MRPTAAKAVEEFVLHNELAMTEYLVVWLHMVADDFEMHGADVADLRAMAVHLRQRYHARRHRGLTLGDAP
jgi:hypothetical protein